MVHSCYRLSHAPRTGGLDGRQESSNVIRKYMPNRTNPKRIDIGDFTGIDHESFALKLLIEFGEVVARILGIVECRDDWRLELARKERFKSQFAHATVKYLLVLRVAGVASRDTTFTVQFGKRL